MGRPGKCAGTVPFDGRHSVASLASIYPLRIVPCSLSILIICKHLMFMLSGAQVALVVPVAAGGSRGTIARRCGGSSKAEAPAMAIRPLFQTWSSRPCRASSSSSNEGYLIGYRPPDVEKDIVDDQCGPRPNSNQSEEQLRWQTVLAPSGASVAKIKRWPTYE